MGCKQVSSKGDEDKKPKEGQENKKDKENQDKKPDDIQPAKEGEIKKDGENKEDKKDDQELKGNDIVIEGLNKADTTEYTVQVMRNSQIAWAKNFPALTVINLIIEQFEKEHKGEPLDAQTKILIDGKVDFDPQKKISDFIQFANGEKVIQVVIMDPVKHQSNGLNLPPDAFEKLKEGQNIVVKPHLNPFGLIMFNNSKKGLVFKSFSQSKIDQYSLNLFSSTSAYCNGNSFLFLSGGERNNQVEGNFWCIELPSLNIAFLSQSMMPKKSHSMIYIPNSFVFIVGGSSRNVIGYETEQKRFFEWGALNKNRIEPSLAFMNNKYLYAISYTKNDLSFERCSLRKEAKWKMITPKLESNLHFTQKFFGIIHESNDTVLFFGGCQMNEEKDSKCFQFFQKKKELAQSSVPFKEIDFIEKTFTHINDKMVCLIPSCSLNDMNIILFNLEAMESEIVHFQQENKPEAKEKKMQSVIQSLKLENLQLNLNMPSDLLLNQELNQNGQQGKMPSLVEIN